MEFERELSQQLKRQLVAHSNHIKDVLREQAREIEKQNQRDLHTKILLERQAFQTEMAGWLARLHGIEAVVEGITSLSLLLSSLSPVLAPQRWLAGWLD